MVVRIQQSQIFYNVFVVQYLEEVDLTLYCPKGQLWITCRTSIGASFWHYLEVKEHLFINALLIQSLDGNKIACLQV